MVQTFVLDTCVLLADPHAPVRFDEHRVVLPLVVVEELDRPKTRLDEVGAGARAAIRLLEELGASRATGLRDPVALPGGGSLRIELNGVVSPRLPAVLDLAAVHDNLHALFAEATDSRGAIEELLARDELELAAITYLRGRSISGELVIVDEAQNLEIPTLKVILTRVGRDSKVVFCGDLTQIDNPYISPYGGMAALIEKFKGSPLFGHVTLERTVRSPLAEMAATLL